MTVRGFAVCVALCAVGGCSSTDEVGSSSVPSATTPATASVGTMPSESTSTIQPPTTLTATTLPPTTVAPATVAPATSVASAADDFLGEETIGYSAQGRPIVASHRGTPGGTVILVVAVIHGNENAGLAVLEDLRTMPLPPGVDLWLMDAMNPDGLANDERHNGNGVDLNRNFPHDWTQVAVPGDWEYSGTGPASEPETQAFMAFADRIRPALTLWYHQDLYRISPSNRSDGPLRERYAEITGLPIISVTGGTYTGVAATWVRTKVPDAMSFIIELGPTLSDDEAAVHATAVLDIVALL